MAGALTYLNGNGAVLDRLVSSGLRHLNPEIRAWLNTSGKAACLPFSKTYIFRLESGRWRYVMPAESGAAAGAAHMENKKLVLKQLKMAGRDSGGQRWHEVCNMVIGRKDATRTKGNLITVILLRTVLRNGCDGKG
ncbi:hypothetical protein [Methylocaldum gracile]|jgi:hypothetical protein|uniref:hypothetical protein n=2 Tax=unclassified Methylocaldum TaxID=2622260 RepID=UPI00105FE9A9